MFGAKLFMDCISETLSADNVLPRGTYVKFDIDDYLSENYLMEKENDNYDTAETGVMPNA
jgi:hypothetical protein